MNALKTQIHERALLAARNFKRSEVDIIRSLQEVKESLLFLDFELDSLNKYAVQIMELSESVAYNFINVANKASQVPVLQDAILNGSVLVSKARKVTSVLTPENKALWPEWVEKIKVLTQKQLEREVAKVNPQRSDS